MLDRCRRRAAACRCRFRARIQFTGIDERLNSGGAGSLEALGIVRIYVAGKAKPMGVVALDQEHHRGAGAFGDHVGELVQVLRAPGRDRIGKLGKARLAHQVHVLDLDIAGRFAVALEQDVDPAVLAVFHLRALALIAGKLGDFPAAIASPTMWLGWLVLMPTMAGPAPRSTSRSSQENLSLRLGLSERDSQTRGARVRRGPSWSRDWRNGR